MERDQEPETKRRKSAGVWRKAILLCSLLAAHCGLVPPPARSQQIVDKMVATVGAPGGARPDLITYSDLIWQMALQPDTPLANPTSENLNRTLQLVINQRLILQEAERLAAISAGDEEVKAALDSLIKNFASRVEFYERVDRVGLSADQLREIIRQRVQIEKYLDFRFRSFTFVTPQEEADYYRDVYAPRRRRRGLIIPPLEEARAEITRILTDSKIESDTDAFLDSARERAEIVILNPV